MIRGQPADWLKKNDSHYLSDISHLEVGLCHQSLRMEFENPKTSYNLLIRNQSCCDQFLQTLTGKSKAVGGWGRGSERFVLGELSGQLLLDICWKLTSGQLRKKAGRESHWQHTLQHLSEQ